MHVENMQILSKYLQCILFHQLLLYVIHLPSHWVYSGGKEIWSPCFQEVECVEEDSDTKPINILNISYIVKCVIK